MKEQILAKLKEYSQKAYSWSPFLCGCAVGYFGRPFLKIALDVAVPALKLLFKL